MKVAIIGLGFMGGMHAQIYSALSGIDLVAIVDPEVADAERKIADMGLSVQVFPDLPALLAGTEVDIIDICTPTDCHADLAVAAAEAGKHLFIEKPLALSLSECEKI